MGNLLQSKKAFKYYVVNIKIPRYIVHYTPRYFNTYALSLNAFLLLATITHEIFGLIQGPLESSKSYTISIKSIVIFDFINYQHLSII